MCFFRNVENVFLSRRFCPAYSRVCVHKAFREVKKRMKSASSAAPHSTHSTVYPPYSTRFVSSSSARSVSSAPRSGRRSGKISRRRFYALVFAAVTLWAVGVTAGSDPPASAFNALRQAVLFFTPPSGTDHQSAPSGKEDSSPSGMETVSGENSLSVEQKFNYTASAEKISDTVLSVKGLSLAAAVALRQSPVLYSVREDVLSRVPESGSAFPGTDTQIPENSRAQVPENSRTETSENYNDTQAVPLSEEAADPDSIIHIPQASGNGGNQSAGREGTPSSTDRENISSSGGGENTSASSGENMSASGGENTSQNRENTSGIENSSGNGDTTSGISAVENPDNGVRAKTLVPTGTNGYTVCGKVYISSSRGDSLSVNALTEPFDAELTADSPQILILHTHGSEAYTPTPETNVVWSGDSRTTDFRYSVVKAGDEMAAVFSDAGISVIHDRTLYDYPNYTGSYDRSLAAIQSYMAQYPSIRFILDVHRDYISDSKGTPYKVISEIDGVGTAAQMTLVMGSDGSGLYHPDWMENLKLAVAIQEQLLSDYPTLMRPILLRRSRYNQHVTTGSLLVEVGTAGNSPEEAFLSARLFARGMVQVLQNRSK